MASKVFLDANVLLDLTLQRGSFEDAKEIIKLIEDKSLRGYTTPTVMHILAYYLTKAYSADTAKEIILSLLTSIAVIETNHEIVLLALTSRMKDIEDAMQYYTAIHYKIEYFISLDKELIKNSLQNLPVLTPKELLTILT